MRPSPFTFATVTSVGYIDQTAGLVANLARVHPERPVVVCALDETSLKAFAGVDRTRVTVVDAEEVWGSDHWTNLCTRMRQSERAFATKAGLAVWALEQHADAVLVLDSDLLFLDQVSDLIDDVLSHEATLVAARRELRLWRKTNTFGLFSAGVVGFSTRGLKAARTWRAMCFEETRAVPADGLYNEQKYLDYLVGFFDVCVVRDPGINVSPTILGLVTPHQDATGRWMTKQGVPIRVFHSSRTAAPSLPLVIAKKEMNGHGLALLRHELGAVAAHQDDLATAEAPGQRRWSLRALVVGFRLGSLIESLPQSLGTLTRRLLTVYRAVEVDGPSLISKLRELLRTRRLGESLWNEAEIPPVSVTEERS